MSSTIAEKLNNVRQQITDFAEQREQFQHPVQLIAVSKTHPPQAITEAWQAGQRHFGENYAQEAVDKAQQLTHLDGICWHFIGPLQSNKTRPIAESMDWVHSVDREKIARRLNQQRPEGMPALNVLVQVNIDGDPNKSGLVADQIQPLLDFCQRAENLTLRGLMTILEGTDDEQAQHHSFKQMRELFERYQPQYENFDSLSMGMSGDMRQAILEGANMVRIGTAIFGKREYL
ncbi:YggS family pyridoxal phosphate-dependent enzyme [Idiomarina tyrosinivorans]|uniref:Pyridoxal phosphate homeostasis protein n=1 Tax=Idiomarina tyrosinivorans TaxID=1445662 RepID=A0A432ZJM6_9GAMM|nr:YggS family pyridoxal phosphate-dependent enzyme [Idiomarina tyrosinivorans]RUO78168.1 YggS family pyridoxal phosphate-dependent enzyme [Idiomarina tyrosinivorans]